MRRIRKGKKNLKDDNNLERNKRGEISDTYKNKSTNRREAEREREREREGGGGKESRQYFSLFQVIFSVSRRAPHVPRAWRF